MPIVSGGSGGGVAGAMTLLSTTTLGVAGTFDIASGLAGYNDLIVTGVLRGTRVAQTDGAYLRLNNDSGLNYLVQAVDIHATTTAPAAFNDNGASVSTIPANTATAAYFAAVTWTIFGYGSTTWNKTIACDYSSPITSAIIWRGIPCAQWINTAAVTRVQVQGVSVANLEVGSKLLIYGRL